MKPTIRAENLSKRFYIGACQNGGYTTLREAIMRGMAAPWHRVRQMVQGRGILANAWKGGSATDAIWALRDVSFDIRPGEVVGIIGRNGAGKSTLLKVLSCITEPTSGQVQIRGRVGSLLEVGTGFHPELTGRENIFLNGSILGMTRREIACKFDAIVAFAEIEPFLDTPVKRYSSGMYVRLAFAVASHMEPEILLVDEVLAVGDHGFQKKCLAKMQETGKLGRTVLLVSHNMATMTRLCDRAILLEAGQVALEAPVSEVVRRYLSGDSDTASVRTWDSPTTSPGDDLVRLSAVRVVGRGGIAGTVDVTDPVEIQLDYWILRPCTRPTPNVHLFNEDGVYLFASADAFDQEWKGRWLKPGLYRSSCHIPANLMAEGRFSVLAALTSLSPVIVHVRERDAVSFQVVDQTDKGVRGNWKSEWPGVVRPLLRWSSVQIDPSGKAPAFSSAEGGSNAT